MGIFKKNKENISVGTKFEMITDRGNGYYAWSGKLYQSDIVRACIKPKTKAIGKAVAKHIEEIVSKDGKDTETKINPEPYIRFLLEEPNPLMTGQMLQEKVANQLALNNNAYILIIRDSFNIPIELFPIPCTSVETNYKSNELFLKFVYPNGKSGEFPYSEIIHIRDDYYSQDVFGDSSAEPLQNLMTCIGTIDSGIINAIRNSGVIRWLLKVTSSLRSEDVKKQAREFAESYMSMDNDAMGVAAVDSKSEAVQVHPDDYVPNAMTTSNIIKRVYAFFNTNENIVNSSCTEDQWISYYESQIEPVITQMSNEFTRKLFTRKERLNGNSIIFESSNLTFSSMKTKLDFVVMVDRGSMTPNEWRKILNLGPVPDGDKPLRRLDTETVNKE